MDFSARQIAEALNGTVDGDPDVRISRLSKIEEGTPGTMTFLANPIYTDFLYTTRASIVVVNNDFVPSKPVSATFIRVENAYAAFAKLLEIFNSMKSQKSGISPMAFISKSAKLGENVSVGEFAFIGDHAVIGDDCRIYPQAYVGDSVTLGGKTLLYPGVKIYHDCVVGSRCILHAGVVIGSDGFGFAPQEDGRYKKIIQAGNVIIEDDVEIGSNTTIDRATLGSTLIHSGVKIDNLVMIAHNVEVGENTIIIAQAGIAGSTKIGSNCIIAGQAGIIGHLVIADNVKIGAQSGVEGSILTPGAAMLGSPAIEAGKAKRNYIHWRNLDDIIKRFYQLEKLVKKQKPG